MRNSALVAITLVIVALLVGLNADVALASAGDDSTWELGTWAIGDFTPRDPSGGMNLNTALEMADGFRWGMEGTLFTAVDIRENQNCKERHLRDPRFTVGGNPGNDQYSFDKNDFGLFVDHGSYNILCFANQVDAWDLQGQYVRWGNWDLEWAYIFACNFTADGGNPTYLTNDKNMMAGIHAVCGWVDTAVYYENSFGQGNAWANLMRGAWPYTYARTIMGAWNDGNDLYQVAGKRLKTWYGPYCWADYLPGVGSYYQSDPIPYESGGLVNAYIYTCN